MKTTENTVYNFSTSVLFGRAHEAELDTQRPSNIKKDRIEFQSKLTPVAGDFSLYKVEIITFSSACNKEFTFLQLVIF